MDMKFKYKCFLARLQHEIATLGHGGKAYIGKNVGKSGAFIGQILSKKNTRGASVDTQIAIANFIAGSEERFFEEGRQIVEYGYIKAELPPIQVNMTATTTPPPQASSSASPLPVIDIQSEADKRHQIVIPVCENKEMAIEINQYLVELEKLEGTIGLEYAKRQIAFLVNEAKEKKGLLPSQKKNGTTGQAQT